MTKTVQMETSAGTMRIELDDGKAPLSRAPTFWPMSPRATTTARCSTA